MQESAHLAKQGGRGSTAELRRSSLSAQLIFATPHTQPPTTRQTLFSRHMNYFSGRPLSQLASPLQQVITVVHRRNHRVVLKDVANCYGLILRAQSNRLTGMLIWRVAYRWIKVRCRANATGTAQCERIRENGFAGGEHVKTLIPKDHDHRSGALRREIA